MTVYPSLPGSGRLVAGPVDLAVIALSDLAAKDRGEDGRNQHRLLVAMPGFSNYPGERRLTPKGSALVSRSAPLAPQQLSEAEEVPSESCLALIADAEVARLPAD